ncbi:N-acetyl-gamma-glutamyl-phosphate reductase, common form [Sphaerochaeta pleomorpha str. Grapes]|uniref:N-acetyl-gamma-glutamyl-phosphate reductase n=1 Tax=Sphaerochaeta pleomorpha (strain ATCC BAA-1885 / DSM 22778 / Grapes) TaxID=158190 RepID=G8QXM2_SPHPG|nr:N-acetyl-gamma-glutamyl-phosphate reductase [Sphaerochaeta pleomorpha]AEV29585.1 N-acetyl-gamma-glutamyl-phosphate reductase, common form [Sphaerochaeta pleomorpha str. Grapes]
MVNVGIIGATGYAGAQLVYLLSNHSGVAITYLASHSYAGKKFSTVYPSMQGLCDLVLEEEDLQKASQRCSVLFLALPSPMASDLVSEEILNRCIVIDLGADFRLSDSLTYETWYKAKHGSKELLAKAVYGLCELNREKIQSASLIANPGCYTTCSILTLSPLVGENLIDRSTIIIDSASGVSGAGRAEKTASLFCECNESCKAYGVTTHRHTPEIEQELSRIAGETLLVQFTPHLVPMNRGILSTCYASLKKGVTEQQIEEAYRKWYGNEPFIRLMGSSLPETRFVKGTNSCAIGWVVDHRTNRVIAVGAIDNLMKGAAGQAVQNMNIRCNLGEQTGLVACVANPL